MNFFELEKYLNSCFDFKNTNILFNNPKVKSIKLLNKFNFNSVDKFDSKKSYSINDSLILFSEDLDNLSEILENKTNFKIFISLT